MAINRWIIIAFICTVIAACHKPRYAHFHTSEYAWMCYDTATVQAQYINHAGDSHTLVLIGRDYYHCDLVNPGSGEEYDHYGYSELRLDSIYIKLELLKGLERPESMYDDGSGSTFHVDLTFGDRKFESINLMPTWPDTTFLVGNVPVNDVIRLYTDTLIYPSADCWRVYYNRDYGILRADLRGGAYVILQ